MDSGILLLLLLITPTAILGILTAGRMDKKIRQEELEHESFLEKYTSKEV
jgi:hypothetical protein